MEVILSTRNPSKAQQIKAVFEGTPVAIMTLEEAGIAGEAVEDGATLEENALKKARFAWNQSKGWCIADDTGFFIDALDGRPGIHAARWAGEGKTTEEIMHYTLEKLRDVPVGKRTAAFRTVAAVITPDGAEHLFTGEVRGALLPEPATVPQPKMPYSALFVPDGRAEVWAQMSVEDENVLSHRGLAFRQVRNFFEQILP